MKNQYEQQLNAAALKQMGVPVIKNLNDSFDMVIRTWINSTRTVEVNYPDMTSAIIDQIIKKHGSSSQKIVNIKFGNIHS